MAYETILFDIDGTLCDPGTSIIESARYALAQVGVIETDEAVLRRFVGPPLEHAFADYYKFDDKTVNDAVGHFRVKMQNDGINLYTVYPGILELLKALSEAGKTLAVVTSKIDYIAKMALESTGLLDYFDVIGAQQPDVVVQKELVLSRVLKELCVEDTTTAVMIGDRMHDIEAANEHGIDSIGVLWGYGTAEELVQEGATYTVKDTKELTSLLI